MSSHPQHTDWILETIDHLRKRKARPDLQRICHVVRRKFGLPNSATEAKLEKLVDAEVVIKVDYKGSTSYRNASKWRKSMIGCAVQNSTTVSTKIIEAIIALTKTGGDDNGCLEERVSQNIPFDKTSGSNVNEKETKDKSACKQNIKEDGVSLEDIEAWLEKNCEGFTNLKSPLNVVLKREIDAGRVEKLDRNGRYIISPAQRDELINDAVILLDANNKKVDSKPGTSQEHRIGESGDKRESKHTPGSVAKVSNSLEKQDSHSSVLHQPSRRGRPPKFRPPEDAPTSVPCASKTSKLKRSASLVEDGKNSQQAKVSKKSLPSFLKECDICSRSPNPCSKSQEEIILKCKDCLMKAHPSCLNYNPLLATRAAKGPWQCMDCKTCSLCDDSAEGDLMLFCDGCDKGYHMTCHLPPVSKKPSGPWECYGCRLENSTLGRNEFAAMHHYQNGHVRDSAPPTPAESPTPSSSTDGQLVSDFPDASKWSVDEVTDYLVTAGFPNEAQVFKDQEIDGVALLLLKREDVLKGLDFKLGPALKVNRIIQGFQTARMS